MTGSGVNGVNEQLSTMQDRYSFMRTGMVTSVNPFFCLVDVGSTVIPAAFLRGAEPDTGDVVVLLRQASAWFVVGTSSGSGGNLVYNPSFEEVNQDQTPVGWSIYHETSVIQVESVLDPLAIPDPTPNPTGRVLEVTPGGTVAALGSVYSRAFGVTVGQVLEVSAYYNGYYPAQNVNTSDVFLRVWWFANATNLYPATSAADTSVVSLFDITEEDSMSVFRGTVAVPAGAVFARVALRSVVQQGAGVHYDYVTARVTG